MLRPKLTSVIQFQGDDTDIEKTIDFIVSLTGVQLPAEYFLKKVCTNVSPDPIKRASTASVYKARFTGGQLVAKKVFEIGKYSEGDVKTYAEVSSFCKLAIQELSLSLENASGYKRMAEVCLPVHAAVSWNWHGEIQRRNFQDVTLYAFKSRFMLTQIPVIGTWSRHLSKTWMQYVHVVVWDDVLLTISNR